LISGTAGVGKTSVASAFVNAAARRGERSLYFAFEESQRQVLRNMRSIGINLAPWVNRGLLQFHAARPTVQGLEMHLLTIHHLVQEFKPQVVVVDPVTNLINVGSALQTRSMLVRLIDFFKTHQITALFTSLTGADSPLDQSEVGISSLIDSWLSLRNLESGSERNRGLFILKSRGMAHSNQIREFILSDKGIELVDVYAGLGTVLVGSARAAQEAREQAELMAQQEQLARRRRLFEHERHAIEAQIANLRADLESRRAELEQEASAEKRRVQAAEQSRIEIARKRMADKNGPPSNSAPPRKTRATAK
jgi:circadian clock protein KaiC